MKDKNKMKSIVYNSGEYDGYNRELCSLKENYACIASSQNRFVLPDLPIAVNLSKCEKALCFFV